MLNKLSKRAGARIVIHDPANPPLPDEYGLDFEPLWLIDTFFKQRFHFQVWI